MTYKKNTKIKNGNNTSQPNNFNNYKHKLNKTLLIARSNSLESTIRAKIIYPPSNKSTNTLKNHSNLSSTKHSLMEISKAATEPQLDTYIPSSSKN